MPRSSHSTLAPGLALSGDRIVAQWCMFDEVARLQQPGLEPIICGALRLEAASPSDFERPDRIGAAPSAADRRGMTLRRIMSKLGGL
jgi:hypothetical protein